MPPDPPPPKKPPPALPDILFPAQANHNFSHILSDLKRANLSITNRLRSIRSDAAFVQRVAAAYGLPLIANERCGSWYVPPPLKAGSAYFKSTDGHAGQWALSTRRLNLHLPGLVGAAGGCVLVDSTRRGKRMPDALSKTVPVWCCVVNRALWPDREEAHALFLPPGVVGASERSQIEARMGGFVDAFLALGVDVSGLRERLGRPLRPVWRTQDDGGVLDGDDEEGDEGPRQMFEDFWPVVCCTSSRRVVGAEMSEGGYIQGAGDDTENWAHGLTAEIFWEHADRLLATPEPELPQLIEELVAEAAERRGTGGGSSGLRRVTPVFYVSALPVGDDGRPAPRTCLVRLVPRTTETATWVRSGTEMEVGIGKSKTAARNLRHALPAICGFVHEFLAENMAAAAASDGEPEPGPRVVVACETGKDLSVGVALALDCWCFDDGGRLVGKDEDMVSFTKTAIRVRLGRIMTAMPEANPSRTTLQSVNSFLMEWPR